MAAAAATALQRRTNAVAPGESQGERPGQLVTGEGAHGGIWLHVCDEADHFLNSARLSETAAAGSCSEMDT